jgi:hypothetical protein
VNVISPITLNPAIDDIVISFVAVKENPLNPCAPDIRRYPTYMNGWAWSKYGDTMTYTGSGATPNKTSQQSLATIEGQMNSCAPAVSLLLVEIFYNYPQTLRAPFYEQVFPDPVPVYIDAIMPIKSITIPY